MPDEPCLHEREQDPDGLLFRFFFHTGLPCAECQSEEQAAWVESVRARLVAGLEAASAGERFDWAVPDPAEDTPRFALVRLDDRIDLALTVDEHGRCTTPAAGRYSFGRVRDEAAAESDERVLAYLRHGVLTPAEAKSAYSRPVEFPFGTGPLFPEGPAGAALYALLNAEPEPGPPYTHTFRPPQTEYDEDGQPIWKPMEPTFTITEADVADLIERDERAFMLGLCPQGHLRRARTRTGTFGEIVTVPYCPTCEGGGDD